MEENEAEAGKKTTFDHESEIEELRRKNDKLTNEVDSKIEAITKLESTLAEKEEEIASLKESYNGALKKAEDLDKTLAGTVSAYRELVAGTNPGVVGDLIKGNSIAEVNESLEKARALMEKVRQGMEADAGRARVPAGAPARTQPELSGLTAMEKIRYAIGGK